MKSIFKEYKSQYNFDVKPLSSNRDEKWHWNFEDKQSGNFTYVIFGFISVLTILIIGKML